MNHPKRRCGASSLVAATLVFAACGSGDDSREARERQMEDYAARYGVDADVELKGEGDDESAVLSVKRPGMDGRVGNDIGVPEDFPDDVAVYSGLKVLSAVKMPNGYMLTAQTDDDPDEVAAFFEREMKAGGWTEQPTNATPTMRSVGFKKGKRIASLNMILGGEKVNVQLGVVEIG